MHLVEASCALFNATQDFHDFEIAKECVSLFERSFFNSDHDILVEFFNLDWSPRSESPTTSVIEVGHMYEWATLLLEYDQIAGHDSLSWRRRLIRQADKQVKLNSDGFAKNAERLDGCPVNSKRRLWPQLEMLRAHLCHPGIESRAHIEKTFASIMETYARRAISGTWIDEITDTGEPSSKTVPASMLYHWVTALHGFIE